jgi:hypothetical protein
VKSPAARALLVAVALLAAACGSAADDTVTDGATSAQETPVPAATDQTSPPSAATTTVVPAEPSDAGDHDGCADVVAVEVRPDGAGFTFAVTVSSTETGWDKYADAWVVKTEDGRLLGERILTHPHVEEQPFTRSQSGIVVPDGVTSVVVAARDSVLGFCGEELTVAIDGDSA